MIPGIVAGTYNGHIGMVSCQMIPPPLYRLPAHVVETKLSLLADYQRMAEELTACARSMPAGSKHSKPNIELEERLTALILKVDAVETEGHPKIRKARKQIVFSIQNALKYLETQI